jgi:TolB-like protein
MKRCPECRRDYYDDTLLYCLDDGNALLEGPASGAGAGDEHQTAILHRTSVPGKAPTREQIDTTDQTAILTAGTGEIVAKPRSFDKRLLFVPLAVAVIVLGGFFGYRYITPASQIESIAVMPFVNESGNADVEYLSDGMTETLISSLSQVPNVNVKGRSSVFRYKGKDVDTKTLGKELGVQAVLYGRVIQRGDQLTLSLELLDAVTENVIWSGKYDRKQSEVVTLQSEIARDVSNKLKTRLSGSDTAKVGKGYTADPEAYKLYLQGRFYWNKRTVEDLKKSIEYFDQAIARDPGYALAYSGLGAVYQVIPGYTLDPPPNVAYPKARTASLKALELDPTLAEPHATLAVVLHEYEWKHPEAESEFKRAIELDPNYASAHQWYGNFLLNMGRFQEAIAELKRAIELDPLSPVINANLGRAYRADRRYDDAIAQYKKTLELVPNFGIAQFNLNKTYVLNGMFEEMFEQSRKNLLAAGVPPGKAGERLTELQNAYRTYGAKGFWQKVLERETEEAKASGREPNPYDLAGYQLGAGYKEQALESLEKAVAYKQGMTGVLSLKAEPTWDPLRADPRFKELLRKIGLPE